MIILFQFLFESVSIFSINLNKREKTMAIINCNRSNKKDKIKLEINSEILKQIHDYCAWQKIDNLSHFFEEAAHFIFSKDKEWKLQKKATKRAEKELSK